MAVVSVTIKSEEWAGSRNEKGDYEFSITFMVLTDSINDGPFLVLNAQDPHTGVRVPLDYDDYHIGHDAISFAFVKTKRTRRDPKQPMLWYVDITYSTATDAQQRQANENPLDRPAIYSWTFEPYQKVVFEWNISKSI